MDMDTNMLNKGKREKKIVKYFVENKCVSRNKKGKR
jgi:hypothetical protein